MINHKKTVRTALGLSCSGFRDLFGNLCAFQHLEFDYTTYGPIGAKH